jgi:CBS-domain-containing membrane protein
MKSSMDLQKHQVKFRMPIDEKFKKLWKYYIWQSFLAAVALFIIVLALDKGKMVVISAMGATAFIVFAMPNAVSANSKNVIGGHLVGLILGMIFFFIDIPYFYEFPIVVGIAIFVMAALDVEHPPAVGTALAVLINEVSIEVVFIIIAASVILSVCHYYLRHHLKDLV